MPAVSRQPLKVTIAGIDVSSSVLRAGVRFGATLEPTSHHPTLQSAAGVVELDDVDGYWNPGVRHHSGRPPGIDASLARRNRARIDLGSDVFWTGWAEYHSHADGRTRLLLRSVHDPPLEEHQTLQPFGDGDGGVLDVAEPRTLREHLDQLGVSAGRVTDYQMGPAIASGPRRSLIDRLAQWSGCYPIETADGPIEFFDPVFWDAFQNTAYDPLAKTQFDIDSFEIVAPRDLVTVVSSDMATGYRADTIQVRTIAPHVEAGQMLAAREVRIAPGETVPVTLRAANAIYAALDLESTMVTANRVLTMSEGFDLAVARTGDTEATALVTFTGDSSVSCDVEMTATQVISGITTLSGVLRTVRAEQRLRVPAEPWYSYRTLSSPAVRGIASPAPAILERTGTPQFLIIVTLPVEQEPGSRLHPARISVGQVGAIHIYNRARGAEIRDRCVVLGTELISQHGAVDTIRLTCLTMVQNVSPIAGRGGDVPEPIERPTAVWRLGVSGLGVDTILAAEPAAPAASAVGSAFERAPVWGQELIRRYMPRAQWNNTAATIECESQWNPLAHNTDGEDSRGIGQINIGPGANTDLAGWDLFDPEVNMRAIRLVWDRQGWYAWLCCAQRLGLV